MGKKSINIANAERFTDAIDLEERAQATVSLSTSEANSNALSDGVYDCWSDVDCWLKVGPSAAGVTSSNGYLLRANNTVPLVVRDGSRINAIAGGNGTLRFHQVA